MKILLFILTIAFLTSCGSKNNFNTVTVASQSAAAQDDDVLKLVDDENAYRLGLGQSTITQGLTCTVQQVSSGQWLSNTSPGYNSGQGVVAVTGTAYNFLLKSSLNQPETSGGQANKLLPTALQPIFLNVNYKLSCSGFIVLTQDGYYNFESISDDGSIVTIDGGTAVVNNDGNHGMNSKNGTKYLRRGVRSFVLSYAQTGGGNFGLIVKADNVAIPGANLYH